MASVILKQTKCPRCGRIKNHYLMGTAFIGHELTVCECDYVYDNAANLYSNSELKRLSDFTTEELKAELMRRKQKL